MTLAQSQLEKNEDFFFHEKYCLECPPNSILADDKMCTNMRKDKLKP